MNHLSQENLLPAYHGLQYGTREQTTKQSRLTHCPKCEVTLTSFEGNINTQALRLPCSHVYCLKCVQTSIITCQEGTSNVFKVVCLTPRCRGVASNNKSCLLLPSMEEYLAKLRTLNIFNDRAEYPMHIPSHGFDLMYVN